MGMPVLPPEESRPLYVRVSIPDPSFGLAEHNAYVDVYLPGSGNHRVDHKVVMELTQQINLWGFDVAENITRESRDSGADTCVQLTLGLIHRKHQSTLEASIAKLDESLLYALAGARFTSAGTASIEEVFLDGERVASKVTFFVTEGDLVDGARIIEEGNSYFTVKHPSTNQYTCFLPYALEGYAGDYAPSETTSWLAKQLGLFLTEQIKAPTGTVVFRAPDVPGA